jgi:hypothetical protein
MEEKKSMYSPEFEKQLKEFIKQPIEGLLYDMNLLPEQLKDPSVQLWASMVITELSRKAAYADKMHDLIGGLLDSAIGIGSSHFLEHRAERIAEAQKIFNDYHGGKKL